jgi:hypothetical protein
LSNHRVIFRRSVPSPASDHHAFLLRLELAGMAPPAPCIRFSTLPSWTTPPLGWPLRLPGGLFLLPSWWIRLRWQDSTAKPFCVEFCQRFSKVLAAKRLQNCWFFTRALELATGLCRGLPPPSEGDGCLGGPGAAVRSHTPAGG